MGDRGRGLGVGGAVRGTTRGWLARGERGGGGDSTSNLREFVGDRIAGTSTLGLRGGAGLGGGTGLRALVGGKGEGEGEREEEGEPN